MPSMLRLGSIRHHSRLASFSNAMLPRTAVQSIMTLSDIVAFHENNRRRIPGIRRLIFIPRSFETDQDVTGWCRWWSRRHRSGPDPSWRARPGRSSWNRCCWAPPEVRPSEVAAEAVGCQRLNSGGAFSSSLVVSRETWDVVVVRVRTADRQPLEGNGDRLFADAEEAADTDDDRAGVALHVERGRR